MNEKDKVEGTAQMPDTAVPGGEKQTGKRLGLREFVITLVIILVVWAAQKCYSAPAPLISGVQAEVKVVFLNSQFR